MVKGVGHVGIAVHDLEESIGFYRDALGFSVVRTFTQPAQVGGAEVFDLSLNPSQIGEVQLLKYPAGSNIRLGVNHVAMLVEDIDSIFAHLLSKGVKFIVEPTPPSKSAPRVARLYGPDNVLIELITFVNR
ncbi:VOC family protein [Chloroflexota bacterium]